MSALPPRQVPPHMPGPGYTCRACEKPHIPGCIRDRDPNAECQNATAPEKASKAPRMPRSALPAVLGAMAIAGGVGVPMRAPRSFDERDSQNGAAAIKRLANAQAKRDRKALERKRKTSDRKRTRTSPHHTES